MIEVVDDDGVRRLTWAHPSGVNVKDQPSIEALTEAIETGLALSAVEGFIISSSARDFIVGADLQMVLETPTANLRSLLMRMRRALRLLERSSKPSVAVINGAALGGGCEVALACRFRIAINSSRVRFAFPELSLGLIPGAGGTQRLPRLIGLERAASLLLDNKALDAAGALDAGLIDAIVPDVRAAETAALAFLKDRASAAPRDDAAFSRPVPHSSEWRTFFLQRSARVRAQDWTGASAAHALLDALYHGLQRPLDLGLEREAHNFHDLLQGREARNRIQVQFFGARSARRESPGTAEKIAVIGAGLMGLGIARVAAEAGLNVALTDVSYENAEASLGRLAQSFIANPPKRLAAETLLSRIRPATLDEGVAAADFVIEAIPEDVALKQHLYASLSGKLKESATLASNTSTLSIGELARGFDTPERFIGMHFFSPVDRMPLVEIIQGPKTGNASIDAARALAHRIGKTAVIARDGPGFFTSRVITRYLREALSLLADGAEPALIENSARLAGLPIGPLALLDETGIALFADIIAAMRAQENGLPWSEEDGADRVLKRLLEEGRCGRRSGGGFYDYPEGARKTFWQGLAEFRTTTAAYDANRVIARLMNIQCVEALRCVRAGVVSANDADVASVLGWGFPASAGGVVGWRAYRGALFDVECSALADAHGARFVLEATPA